MLNSIQEEKPKIPCSRRDSNKQNLGECGRRQDDISENEKETWGSRLGGKMVNKLSQ